MPVGETPEFLFPQPIFVREKAQEFVDNGMTQFINDTCLKNIQLKKNSEIIFKKMSLLNSSFAKLEEKMEQLNKNDFLTQFAGEKGAIFTLLNFIKI